MSAAYRNSGGVFRPHDRQTRNFARRLSLAPLIRADSAFIMSVSGSRPHFTDPTRRGLTTSESDAHSRANSKTATVEGVRCTTTSTGSPPENTISPAAPSDSSTGWGSCDPMKAISCSNPSLMLSIAALKIRSPRMSAVRRTCQVRLKPDTTYDAISSHALKPDATTTDQRPDAARGSGLTTSGCVWLRPLTVSLTL